MSSNVDKVETCSDVDTKTVSAHLPVDFLEISAVLVVFVPLEVSVVFVPLEVSGVSGALGVFEALETDAETDDCLCCYNCCSA